MKRIAFTIVLNGLNHLTHNDYYNRLAELFDLWVIVEGVSNPGGSTSWCNKLDNTLHRNFLSNDGTTEFLDQHKRPNVIVVRQKDTPWESKDQQVNAAILEIKKHHESGFLWQIDVDEQWSENQLKSAEDCILSQGGKTGCFMCNYFVGPNQQVFGDWGEGKNTPYRRLWVWNGELFKTHEPPQLDGKNGPGLLLPQRFNHYAYYFENDVIFKEKYYGGYDGLVNRWKEVQNNRSTIHIKQLLGPNLWWSNTNTIIKYINDC